MALKNGLEISDREGLLRWFVCIVHRLINALACMCDSMLIDGDIKG